MIKNCLIDLRKRRGYTQQQLAKKIGVSRQTIISIEKGQSVPSISVALKLAKILKYKVEDIFKEK